MTNGLTKMKKKQTKEIVDTNKAPTEKCSELYCSKSCARGNWELTVTSESIHITNKVVPTTPGYSLCLKHDLMKWIVKTYPRLVGEIMCHTEIKSNDNK